MREAYEEYDLRAGVNESKSVPDIPEDHTDLEAADAAFNAHYDEDAYDIDLKALQEARMGLAARSAGGTVGNDRRGARERSDVPGRGGLPLFRGAE